MRAPRPTPTHLHGVKPVGLSRYFALYFTQAGWLVLGFYLLTHAYWPSTCRPHSVIEIYGCSSRLGESAGMVEAMLMTWLWTTPMLIGLEVMRRLKARVAR